VGFAKNSVNVVISENFYESGFVLHLYRHAYLLLGLLRGALAANKEEASLQRFIVGIYSHFSSFFFKMRISGNCGLGKELLATGHPIFAISFNTKEIATRTKDGEPIYLMPFNSFINYPLSDYINLETYGLQEWGDC
jgi:hypothetical protein